MSKCHKCTGQSYEKKMRKVGTGSWAIPIPKGYADHLTDTSSGNVELYFMNGNLIISPYSKAYRKEIKKGSLITELPEEIESSTYAAYLRGYDSLILDGYTKMQKEGLDVIKNKLPGASHELSTSKSIKIDFNLEYSSPEESTQKAYSICREFASFNDYDMNNFPDITLLDANGYSPHHDLEEEIDKTSFRAKRIMAVMATMPSKYKGTVLDDIRDVFQYNLILSNLERLSNLQDGISRHLRILKKYETDIPKGFFIDGKYPIYRYHNNCFEMVGKAFESWKNPELAYDIIKSKNCFDKHEDIRYRSYFISLEQRKEVLLRINRIKSSEKLLEWRMNLLEQSIWGMTKIAINITELGQNLYKFERK